MVKPRTPRALELLLQGASEIVVTPSVRTGKLKRRQRSACRSDTQVARRADSPRAAKYFCYYVDADGRQHFNFTQQIWLRPQVEMAVTSVRTVALETLAVNLLTLVTRERDWAAAVGVTSRRVMKLADRFCTDCLLSAHTDGWIMPRAAVRAWLATQMSAAQSRGRQRAAR